MADVITDLGTVLATAGVGTVGASSGWGIFYGHEPDSPDTSITLYHYGGRDPHPAWLIDDLDVQVRIRGARNGYSATQAKVQDVKDVLLGLPQQVVATTTYVGVWMSGDILFLAYDDNNRPIFVTNWRVVREPSSTASTLSYREAL